MPPATQRRRRQDINRLCTEPGGDVHTWEATGLDTNGQGVLVNTWRCLRCERTKAAPYGGKRARR